MKKTTFIKYQLIIIFLVLVFLPGMSKIVGLKDFARKDENRRFNDSLTIDIKKLDKFPSDFNSYVNDNFYFRAPLLGLFHRMKYYAFNISPHPKKTLIGEDGWYFIGGKEIEILKGKLDFSPIVLDSFTNEWKNRIDYFDRKGIPVYWIIAPMKHTVYTDKLPYNVDHSHGNRITVLTAHLQKYFPDLIINPLEELRAHKDKENLYFKLDNHWNTHAGYLTMQLLIEKLRMKFPDKEVVDVPSFHWKGKIIQKGIHYSVLGIDELSEYSESPVMDHPHSRIAEKYGFKGIDMFAYPNDFEKHFVNDSLPNGLRVLIIRDSYGAAVIPFAREIFKESLFIFDAWEYKINKTIVEQFKPDVVIYLGLETNVDNFIEKHGSE